MFADRILLVLLLLAPTGAFMVHNTRRSLCMDDSAASGEVVLRRCNLDSVSQQWVWVDQNMLMNEASSRCLWAQQPGPPRTRSCSERGSGPGSDPSGLLWDCDRDRLISRNLSMMLAVDGRRPVLSHDSKQSRWRSVDGGDICQERQRSRRSSDEPDEFESTDEQAGAKMTEEQREYLRWFYRTEDPTTWKFVLLGLAFVCLLVGFMLLGMGVMANKNRKKIAKYKAAAALAQMGKGEQLQVISALRDDSSSKPSPSPERVQHRPPPPNGELSELKAGSIVVTWKDGNTSCLYPDTKEEQQEEQEEEQGEEEKQEEQGEEEKQEEDHAEVSADEPVKAEE
ncbi:solute carrier family 51 subunit beta [Cheilinus undulatus]|uniref:solute carrier family 51 subunit beta n=1 Tax=Cheilinus undulatus TaxID=241271 RepID=UPI001BD6DA19|nr:solute carrier family 51 subunit beta [Cheilinus undulatus]XP_041640753.1 solute carrier family 51 subunit beta [Cheilinus undulatus]